MTATPRRPSSAGWYGMAGGRVRDVVTVPRYPCAEQSGRPLRAGHGGADTVGPDADQPLFRALAVAGIAATSSVGVLGPVASGSVLQATAAPAWTKTVCTSIGAWEDALSALQRKQRRVRRRARPSPRRSSRNSWVRPRPRRECSLPASGRRGCPPFPPQSTARRSRRSCATSTGSSRNPWRERGPISNRPTPPIPLPSGPPRAVSKTPSSRRSSSRRPRSTPPGAPRCPTARRRVPRRAGLRRPHGPLTTRWPWEIRPTTPRSCGRPRRRGSRGVLHRTPRVHAEHRRGAGLGGRDPRQSPLLLSGPTSFDSLEVLRSRTPVGSHVVVADPSGNPIELFERASQERQRLTPVDSVSFLIGAGHRDRPTRDRPPAVRSPRHEPPRGS